MSNSIVAQIPKNLLFRYRLDCQKFDGKPGSKFELSDSYQIPALSEFEDQPNFADVRVGWCEQGLFVSASITQKKQSLWCKETQLLESDGLQIWVDTRATHNVHRASKFCHWFAVLPTGGGGRNEKPIATMLKINRSKDDSPAINRSKIDVASTISKTGYQVNVFLPAQCLNGWDTNEHRNLGFNFAIVDRELGWQTLAIGPELPISEDPSMWQTMRLVD
jgi:hypothetical protein